MFQVKNDNPNYLAKIFAIETLAPHQNANKLQICVLDGQKIITGLEAKVGDIYVFFPIESQINFDYLSYTNSFEDKELNKDKDVRGFFRSAMN